MNAKGLLTFVTLAGLLSSGVARASSISMPAGSRSWIVVSGSDCDDDGAGTADRSHCVAAVSNLSQPGDIGHGWINSPSYSIEAIASINAESMRGVIHATPGGFVFLDMSMVDTYTLASTTLPPGTVVPLTVNFNAVATMIPDPIRTASGVLVGYGGGTFAIRIGNFFDPNPIVIPENTRVNNVFGAAASPGTFTYPSPGPAPVPLSLAATATLDVAIGTPFDLAYYLAARPNGATFDFSHTATIGFVLPPGTTISSTGGYGLTTPVRPSSWGKLRTLYR